MPQRRHGIARRSALEDIRSNGTGILREFKDFILRGNVVELAIGVVIGVAFAGVVTALVKDLITPLVAALGGQPDFSGLYFTINRSTFRYGDFINSILSFLIIGAVVFFFVVLPMNRLVKARRSPSSPDTRQCPECLSEIPRAARRCRYCGSPSAPPPQPPDLPAGVKA